MERERQGEKAVYDNTRNVSPAITFRFFGTASCFLHRYCCCILFFLHAFTSGVSYFIWSCSLIFP